MIQLTRQFAIDSDQAGGGANPDKSLAEEHEVEGDDKMNEKVSETLDEDFADLRGTELDNTEKNNTMATES